MSLLTWFRRQKKRRRDRIYGGPCIDGGTRICNDTDAPKEIVSRDLTRFSCTVSTLSLAEEDTRLRCAVYSFEAEATEAGVRVAVSCSRGVDTGMKREETREDAFLTTLEALIRAHDVARLNGKSYKVSGLPDFYGSMLSASYASGEEIYCCNNQDPILPIAFLRELCRLFGVINAEVTL